MTPTMYRLNAAYARLQAELGECTPADQIKIREIMDAQRVLLDKMHIERMKETSHRPGVTGRKK